MRRSAALLGAVAIALALSAGARTASRGGPPRDPTTLLVKFVSQTSEAGAISSEGDKHVGDITTHVAIVKIGTGDSVDTKVAAYQKRSDVVYAEPNFIAHATLASPNDPSFGSQYGFTNTQAVAGWSIYPGSYTSTGGARLAVVDTGVQANHPDLTGRVLTGSGATCLTGTCVASTANDDNGHGTHVAGIAGATTNNAVGVAGTAFSSQILPVKVLDSTGTGSFASVASGILWASSHGARTMNLSLGGAGFSQTLCDAVTTALSNGALVVAAAGNNNTSTPSYPAACPGAVGVAATDSNDAKASFSNFGNPNVFVSAPGVSIFSTYFGSTYATLSGTSMATPFVTGLTALLLGQDPTRTPTALKLLLAQTSDKVGSGYGADPYGTCTGCTWSSSFGYGRINVFRALSAAGTNPDFSLTRSPASRTIIQGATTSYKVTITPAGGFSGAVNFSASGLPAGATGSFSPNPGTLSSKLTVVTSASTPVGTSTITITGTNGSLSHSVTVTLNVQSSAPDFTLSASPGTLTVRVGDTSSYSVAIGRVNGFAGSVTLSASGVPAGTSASFSPNPATSSSTLTIAPSLTATQGTFTLTITGVSGSLTHTATVTLKIKGNYVLSASPSSRTVAAGGSTAYTVTVSRYSFGTAVNLSVSGLPSGATASFSPNPAGASSTLTVTTGSSTPPGTYTLTITGSAGTVAVVHTTTVTLVVT
jgi:thermitase